MLEHGSGGAMGIVVNRPATIRLGDIARGQGLPLPPAAARAHVFVGGPVEPERGFVLHKRHDLPEAIPLFEELFVSGSVDSLRILLQGPSADYRLCLGYAGWGPGQIEQELREGAWITAGPSSKHVLETPPEQAWERVLREMGIDPAMLLHGGGLH